jgi:hypothetical protein
MYKIKELVIEEDCYMTDLQLMGNRWCLLVIQKGFYDFKSQLSSLYLCMDKLGFADITFISLSASLMRGRWCKFDRIGSHFMWVGYSVPVKVLFSSLLRKDV